MAHQPVVARDLRAIYTDRVIFDGVSVIARPGIRLGVVGENGSGKTTLLRIIAGELPADAGTISRPDECVYVDQDPVFEEGETVEGVFAEALEDLHHGLAEVERLGQVLAELSVTMDDPATDEPDPVEPDPVEPDPVEPDRDPGLVETGPVETQRGEPASEEIEPRELTLAERYADAADEYTAAMQWAVDHEAWDADHRAALMARRLGIASISSTTPVAELSGGQRARLAIAAALTRRPDCLLLDEPTNHLDDDACAALEDYLVRYRGVVLIATHDRTFLDSVCTDILDLDAGHLGTDGQGGMRFHGTFSQHLAEKRRSRARWQKAYEEQEAERARLLVEAGRSTDSVAHNRAARDNDKFIYAFKGENVQAALARRVRNAEKRLEIIDRTAVPRPPAPLRFSSTLTGVPAAAHGPDPALAISVQDVEVAGRMDLEELRLERGDKLLITGANGAGKSTLLQVFAGQVQPTAGHVTVRGKVGLLDQESRIPDPSLSPRQIFERATRRPGDVLGEMGLLHDRDLDRPTGELSVGQQKRVLLAVLVGRQPAITLLDEPTNHLSLTLVTELEDAMRVALGTVVVASHDRWLRARWDGQRMHLLAPGTPQRYRPARYR